MDFEEPSDSPPPVSSGSCGSMKEITQIISDLKKENFDLKLRAFYYEERLHEQRDASVQDVDKTNIDLKLEVETLKEEIKKLQRASARAPEKDPLGMGELNEHSGLRIAQLEKDLELSRVEMESLTNLLEQARLCILELENDQRDPPAETEPSRSEDRNLDLLNAQEERDRLIEQLQESVHSQDAIINRLRSSHAGSDQPTTDSNYQPLTLVDLQAPEQDDGREKRRYDKQLREVQELLYRATEEMVKKDTLLADAQLKVKSLEITSQKLNTKLQETEQFLLSLGKELSDQKIKYESKVRELQDALEESSKDVSNKDFLLSEMEIKMKEQEDTINTLTCMLQEKVQLIQMGACSDNPSDCQQQSVLEQEIKDLKEALKKAPTKDGLLFNAQESINRDSKEPLLVTAENSKDLGELQMHLLSSPYDSLTSNLQEAVRALDSVVKDMDQNILSAEKVFTQLAQAEKVLRENLSCAIQQKDFMISQLQQQLHQISAHLWVTSRQLHVKSNNSCEDTDRVKQCVKEARAILVQTTEHTERELIISNIRLLESTLKEMEDGVFKVAVRQLHKHQCAGEMMQARDEACAKKAKALENRLKGTRGVLVQTTVKLFQDDKPADREVEACDIQLDVLEQAEHRLSDAEDTAEDEQGPLTYLKSTKQKPSASEVRRLDRNLAPLRCEEQERRLSYEILMKRLKASDGLNKILSSQLHLCRNIMAQWDGNLSSCVIPSLLTVDKETEGKRCSATIIQNQERDDLERLLKVLGERTSKVNLLRGDCELLKEEIKTLVASLACVRSGLQTLDRSLGSAREEMNRLKGEIGEKEATHSQDILKVHVQDAAIPSGSECGITSQEIALSSRVLSEIEQIKERFAPKSTQEASTQTPKEPPAKQFGCLEHPRSVINVSYVEYGEDKSSGRDPLDAINGTLPSCPRNKNPDPAARQEDLIGLQQLRAEGKVLTTRMAQLLQETLDSKIYTRAQSNVEQEFMSHLSAVVTANQRAIEEAFLHLICKGRSCHRNDNCIKISQSTKDLYEENLKLNKEMETLKMEQSRHKKILSEALQQLRRVNRRKLERLCD